MRAAPIPAFSPGVTRIQAEFVRECVEVFADAVQLFGVPRSVGQIYGLLYSSPLPLSFSDIVEQLRISKGSASQGLQLLRELGAIHISDSKLNAPLDKRDARQAGGAPGSAIHTAEAGRREYFEPELSLRKLLGAILSERMAPLASTSVNRLTRLRELADQVGDGNDFYLDRVKQLNTWRKRLKAALPVLGALLGSKGGR
jgi:hypothetical protein